MSLSFDAYEVAQSKSISKNDGHITKATLTSDETGTFEHFMNADGNTSQFNTITENTRKILWAKYNFNNDFLDASGNGYTLTNSGVTFDTGKLNQCAIFNGSSYLTNSSFSMTGRDQKTISAWVYVNDLSVQRVLWTFGGYYGVNIETDGRLRMELNSTVGTPIRVYSVGTINTGSWNHIVLKMNRSNFNSSRYSYEIDIYINGVLQSKTSSSIGTGESASATFYVGCYNPSTTGTMFNGKIDDLRIYTCLLTSAQILEIYNSGNGTESDLTFSEYESGIIGNYSKNFCGETDYFQLGTSTTPSDLVFDYTTSFTWSLWFYPREIASTNPIGLIGRSYKSAIQYTYRSPSQINIIAGVRNSAVLSRSAPTKGNINQWNHVVFRYNAETRYIYLDVNGVIDTTGLDTSSQNFNANSSFFIAGLSPIHSGNSNAFNGLIDEVRLYNRFLSNSESLQLYNKESITDGLVAKYSFEEGQGTKAYDTSNWERVESGVSHAFDNPGQDLKFKIVENGGTTGTIDQVIISGYK